MRWVHRKLQWSFIQRSDPIYFLIGFGYPPDKYAAKWNTIQHKSWGFGQYLDKIEFSIKQGNVSLSINETWTAHAEVGFSY